MYLTQRFQVVFMLFDVKLPWYRAGIKICIKKINVQKLNDI